MGVGIQVGSIIDELGTAEFLHAFFSTLSARLESHWGARFQHMMRLYDGLLTSSEASAALAELDTIRSELAAFSPDQVVWDIENQSERPPWGSAIASDITNLSNYFVTSTGRDLIETMQEALEASRDQALPSKIVRTPPFCG
jgi:hypothetical protein